MSSNLTFFLFFLLLITFPISNAYAVNVKAHLFGSGEAGFNDDEIILNDDLTLDLSFAVEEITEITKTIGDIDVDLTLQVEIGASGDEVILKNTQLPSVEAQIPKTTNISAPSNWNQELAPPKSVIPVAIEVSGFQTPTSAIQIGSPDVILVFDKAVTLVLKDIVGQTAYKLPGQTSWTLISTCLGTYDVPIDPPINGECSISNEIDTKIVTFHFTEFTELTVAPSTSTTSTSTSTTSSSGGGGRTGVGSSGGSGASSSAGFAGRLLPEGVTPQIRVFPNWFQTSLVSFWVNDLITDDEFKNAMNYLLNENIIKIDVAEEKKVPLLDLAPSIKSLFKLWTSEQLTDSAIIKIVTYYRTVGVW